jgi:hypothetical protein
VDDEDRALYASSVSSVVPVGPRALCTVTSSGIAVPRAVEEDAHNCPSLPPDRVCFNDELIHGQNWAYISIVLHKPRIYR